MGLRQEINTICFRKMPSNETENIEKFETFRFDTISAVFPVNFVKSSKTIKNETTSYAVHFLKRSLQRFASKTFQNDSTCVGK